jgi:hypothetical protein
MFGLFIDRLKKWLIERAGELGVQPGDGLLWLLLYADDLALLADSAQGLQALLITLLHRLQGFCDRYQMHVVVAKCEGP